MSTHPTPEPQSQSSAPSAQSTPGTQDKTICIRSVKASCFLGLATLLFCAANHHDNWAWGFLIGGMLSLFSMVTLMLAVPFLTWSGAPRHMSALMIVTLFLKLPIFCLGLYLATSMPGISAFACFLGICLVPAAITLQAVNSLLRDWLPVRAPKTARVNPEPVKTQAAVKPARKVSTEFAREQV